MPENMRQVRYVQLPFLLDHKRLATYFKTQWDGIKCGAAMKLVGLDCCKDELSMELLYGTVKVTQGCFIAYNSIRVRSFRQVMQSAFNNKNNNNILDQQNETHTNVIL